MFYEPIILTTKVVERGLIVWIRIDKIKLILHFPWAFSLILFWAVLRISGIGFAGPTFGLIWAFVCLAVFILEFVKSGDIELWEFTLDLAFAILEVLVLGIAMTIIVLKAKGFHSGDFFVGITILAEAFVGLFNSFRMALRNWMAGGGGHHDHGAQEQFNT